jgi:hypothetical protein
MAARCGEVFESSATPQSTMPPIVGSTFEGQHLLVYSYHNSQLSFLNWVASSAPLGGAEFLERRRKKRNKQVGTNAD